MDILRLIDEQLGYRQVKPTIDAGTYLALLPKDIIDIIFSYIEVYVKSMDEMLNLIKTTDFTNNIIMFYVEGDLILFITNNNIINSDYLYKLNMCIIYHHYYYYLCYVNIVDKIMYINANNALYKIKLYDFKYIILEKCRTTYLYALLQKNE